MSSPITSSLSCWQLENNFHVSHSARYAAYMYREPVAGSANENKVYVWDTECRDKLLTLDHGGKFVNLRRMIVLISGTEGSKVHTLVVHQVQFYQRSW